MSTVIGVAGLGQLLELLRADGRTVIGPTVRDGVITHAEIDDVDDLPRGWTDEQEGGHYRLVPTGTDEVFAFAAPATSWKRFLQPERTLLVKARRADGRVHVLDTAPERPRFAFVGVRSCDLAAIGLLDRVFLDPDATDPTYAARRDDVFVVAAACNRPARTCFCVSMDTGPTPSAGFDLAVRELVDNDRVEYLVEACSERGDELLAALDAAAETRAPTADDENRGRRHHDDAVAAMSRTMAPEHPPLAAAAPDHPRWEDVAERCLACGNCTMACPSCFCSTTEDHTDLTGTDAERWRVWDSCFTLDFSHLPGGSVRTSTKSRYRQWLLHKLVTWHDQFGTSGCVGCGRCITWCPVGIDLTAEIAALAEPPPSGGAS